MRIISFIPSATEMVCALGLADQLVGITHECDYPEHIRTKPVVVRNALDLSSMSLAEIDRSVSERLGTGGSLYNVDEKLVADLAPDLILTQNLCQVCAPSGNEVTRLLESLPKPPQILWLTPRSLAGIDDNIRDVGKATGRTPEAEALIDAGHARLKKITDRTAALTVRSRVFCMEWVDPIYCSGHWVPEMIGLAGGEDQLSRQGTDSVRIPWEDVRRWDPEILIVNPCGFSLKAAVGQVPLLWSLPGWDDLSAVRQGRVYAVDANSYFARPGPRVIDGTELLAHLFHPKWFEWKGSKDAFLKIQTFRKTDALVKKICHSCGAAFECGGSNCWCKDAPPLAAIQSDADCLCKTCLQKTIASPSA